MIPENTSIKMLAFGLAMAHFVYGDKKACILFIVQPGEKNVRSSCCFIRWHLINFCHFACYFYNPFLNLAFSPFIYIYL